MKRKSAAYLALGCLLLGSLVGFWLWRMGSETVSPERPATVDFRGPEVVVPGVPEAGEGQILPSLNRIPALPLPSKAERPLESRGEVLERRVVASGEVNEIFRELLLEVEDLPYPVRVVKRVAVDPHTGEERVLEIEEMVGDRLIARLAEGESAAALQQELARYGASLGRQLLGDSLFEVRLSDAGLERYASFWEAFVSGRISERLLYLEPDYIVHAMVEPDDVDYVEGDLWGLNNKGQSGGVADVDIDAPEAWDVRTRSGDVVVAVIDTGINYQHEDLVANLWVNASEIAGNGLDDDQNGYIDDVYGVDAINDTGDPMDDNGHGSHCAGTIGAAGNNGVGVAGVAWTTRLMGLKFLSSGGSGALSDAIKCIEYAVTMGADVLNNSWGGGGYSQALFEAISVAEANGVVFVAAAGNSGLDTDEVVSYPAGYEAGNVLAVAAVDRNGALAPFSNFGLLSVDVAAPGVSIVSTWSGTSDAYRSISGTSMAAPHVSGIVALLLAEYPEAALGETINRLKYGAKELSSLRERVGVGGLVSARRSLDLVEAPFPPEFVTRPERSYFVKRGGSLVVALTIESESPVTYRWFRDDELLTEEVGSTLEIENLDTEKSGSYRVEVASDQGVAKSYFSVNVLDAVPSLAEAFEASPRDVYTLGDATWDVYFSDSVEGGTSVRSGAIADSEESVLRTQVRGPGIVSFNWRVSAEPVWDVGTFRVDGAVEARLFSEGDWELYSLRLDESRDYVLEWSYAKDSSRAVGQDALFLDGFRFDSVEGSSPVIVRDPESAVVGPGAHHALAVEALGESLRYQWYADGEPIEGADDEVLILLNLDPEDSADYYAVVSNQNGEARSASARLRVAEVAAKVVRSPTDQTRSSGESARFSAVVDGSLPIAYQWYKDGQLVAGANKPEFSIDGLDAADAGEYFLRISNAYTAGFVDSEVAELTIEDVVLKPVIVKQPTGGYWQEVEALRLSVAVEGTRPFSYQWYRDDTILAGAIDRHYETLATAGDAGKYNVVVSNEQGVSRSDYADVVVVGDLAEALDLEGVEWELWGAEYLFSQSETSFDGEDALQTSDVISLLAQRHGMRASVEGPANFSVRWKQAVAIAPSSVTLSIDGVPQAVLNSESDWARVSVKVPEGTHVLEFEFFNEQGSRVWLDRAELNQSPFIYAHPESQILLEGESLSLSVDAFGAGDLSYQWFRDDVAIEGAVTESYSPSGFGGEVAGRYRVEVQSAFGVVVSEMAVVEFLESLPSELTDGSVVFRLDPESDWEPWRDEQGVLRLRSRDLDSSEPLHLTALAEGSGVLVVKMAIRAPVCCPNLDFSVDGESLDLSIPSSGAGQALEFRAFYVPLASGEHSLLWEFSPAADPLAREQFAAIESAYVTTAPIITRQPLDVRVLEGESVELSIDVFDASDSSYQWFSADGMPVSGARDSVLRFDRVEASLEGDYYCEVTNGAGESTRSEPARIEVVEGFYEAVELDFGTFSSGTEFWTPQNDVSWDGDDALAFEAGRAGALSNLWLDLDWMDGMSGSLRFRLRIESLGSNAQVAVQQPGGKIFHFYEDSDWREIVFPINEQSSRRSVVFVVSRPVSEADSSLKLWLDDFEFVAYPVVYDEPSNVRARYGEGVLLEPRVVGSELRYQWFRDGEAMQGETGSSLRLNGSFSSGGRYRMEAHNELGQVSTREVDVELLSSSFGVEAGRQAAFSAEGESLWDVDSDSFPGSGPSLFVEGVRRGESSDLYFLVNGPGRFGFDWRLDSSRNGEQLYCYIYDTLVSGVFSEGSWRAFSFDLPEERVYPFRVSLTSLAGDERPGGRAWVDNLRFYDTGANGYSSWVDGAFAGSSVPESMRVRDEDADADGLANGVEYFFSLDPTKADRFPAPKLLENDTSFTVVLDLVMNFSARDARVGFEISEDLATWYPMDSLLLRTDAGEDNAVLLADIDGEDSKRPLFVRVAVYFDFLQ